MKHKILSIKELECITSEFRIEKNITSAGTTYLLMNLFYYPGTKIPEFNQLFFEN